MAGAAVEHQPPRDGDPAVWLDSAEEGLAQSANMVVEKISDEW